MRSLFISDLHLTPKRPDITRAFVRFLEQEAKGAKALYILGDFFEYSVGDDVLDDFQLTIAQHLHTLASTGVAIYFMHGNRDFLLGERFCQLASCKLLKDPSVICLSTGAMPKILTRVLLMHGDSLCTDDLDYQRFRQWVRKPWLQKLFLALPGSYRRKLAEKIRTGSHNIQNQQTMRVDVNQQAVQQALGQHQLDILIHGHTHQAAIHNLNNDQQRIVLGDWDHQGWYLSHDDHGFQLIDFPINDDKKPLPSSAL